VRLGVVTLMDAAPKPCDQLIDVCEVADNNVVRNVLGPDVQLFTDDGTQFHPTPEHRHKDSLSLGIAFTAKLRE